jgi:hypothetical protein
MALFDGYFAPRQFGEGGGLLGRLLALQQQQGQYQPGAGFDTASAPQMAQPTSWSNLPGDRASSGERSAAPNLNSQYRALRSVLGDHNAMLATVDPETRKALVAQSLAGQQGVYSGDNSPEGATVLSDASPDPIRPGSQYAQPAMGACVAGPAPCAVGVGITAAQAILGSAALGGLGALNLENRKARGPGNKIRKLPPVADAPDVAPSSQPAAQSRARYQHDSSKRDDDDEDECDSRMYRERDKCYARLEDYTHMDFLAACIQRAKQRQDWCIRNGRRIPKKEPAGEWGPADEQIWRNFNR